MARRDDAEPAVWPNQINKYTYDMCTVNMEAGVEPTVAEVYDMPGHLVRRFQQIAVAVFHSEVGAAGYDLTPVQYAALVAVATNPGLDQATLAGLIAYDRATIGGVVERLVQKGFLARRVSGRDRRARELHVTDAWRTAAATVAPAVLRAQKLMLTGLTPDESGQFMELLRKAITAANDLSRAPLRLAPADDTAAGRDGT